MARNEWPYIEWYGYPWMQHPDGLYYGPPYPSANGQLVSLEEVGMFGYASVRRGDYRFFLRDLDDEEDEG